jgi:uncharacterized membrane protein YheB (UPF0754 family)
MDFLQMMNLQQIVPYVLPPLLGAVIGYVTNYIAIRMLFRPLRAWRIFGLRVPLTPGIIPSKRDELAQKMGEMVGSHLLTAEDVGRALEKEAFRRELQQAVAEKLGVFLDRELGPVASLVPEKFRDRFRELVELLRWKAVKALFEYLEGEEFEKTFRDYLRRRLDELLQRDPASFMAGPRRLMLMGHVNRRLGELLASEGVGRGVERLIDEQFAKLLESPRSLKDLLPEDLVEALLVQIEREIPALLEHFGGLLYDPDFRERLVARGREALEKYLGSLGGLTNLLKGFINVDKLAERIPGFLDQAGEEIAVWLRKESTQHQVAAMLRGRVEILLDRQLCTFVQGIPYEKVAGVRRFVRNRAVAWVQGPSAAQVLRGLLERGLDSIKDRSFAELLEQILPAGGLDRSRELLATRLLAALRSPGAREGLDRLLTEKADLWLFRQPLGRLSARMSADVRMELHEGLFLQLTEILKKEVPPLVETLNIQRVVEEKVNSLDILKVEDLLMGIMKEQFKYINLFGALLGAMIGLINLLILGLV